METYQTEIPALPKEQTEPNGHIEQSPCADCIIYKNNINHKLDALCMMCPRVP